MARIVIPPKAPVEIHELLDLIFRSPRYASIAEKILRRIRGGNLTAKDWEHMAREFGAGNYYYVMNTLRSLGLVQKKKGHHGGEYILSRKFSNRLRDIARLWELWAFGGENE